MANEISPNPGVAAVLSFFFSGLGQIYNGEIKKGLLIMFFSCLGLLMLLVGAVFFGYYILGEVFFKGQFIGGLILFLGGIFLVAILGTRSIFDAYSRAKEK